jgi:hypothetical protein
MAIRHLTPARAVVLAALLSLFTFAGSASASTATSVVTGTVSASAANSQTSSFGAAAGSAVSVQLAWPNTAARLTLRLYAPDGTLLASRTGAHNPKAITATAPTAGTYTARVTAASGQSAFTLQVSVTANDPPAVAPVSASTVSGTSVTVTPLAGASDSDGDAVSLSTIGAPAHGAAAAHADGTVTYTPAGGYVGPDAFAYTACDSGSPVLCASSTVDVTVTTPPNLLRWAPPALSNPVTITLPATGDVTENLDNSKDYIIRYPSVRRWGELHLIGGRNIVIIGGASTIPPHTGTGERNLLISDKAGVMVGRVVHVEGLDIDASGGGEADGIGIDAPSAVIQLENDRITGLIGHLSSTHADVVQTFGGFQELRMYDVTGASHYNDLYLRRENSPLGPPMGTVILDHVNMFGYVNPAGWDIPSTIRAISIGTQPVNGSCDSKGHCGPANPDDSINCQFSSPMTLSSFYGAPPAGKLQRFMWPTDYMQTAGCPSSLTPDGQAAYWPTLTGLVSGVMQVGPPPGGDYVPAGSVGVGYVSPGYQAG